MLNSVPPEKRAYVQSLWWSEFRQNMMNSIENLEIWTKELGQQEQLQNYLWKLDHAVNQVIQYARRQFSPWKKWCRISKVWCAGHRGEDINSCDRDWDSWHNPDCSKSDLRHYHDNAVPSSTKRVSAGNAPQNKHKTDDNGNEWHKETDLSSDQSRVVALQ